ncbi:MAG: DNA polymerase Y family protein [Phycisphaerales bacterium]|nr:DNA polymerase Y family protein [Phycisphaerales bacterium]
MIERRVGERRIVADACIRCRRLGIRSGMVLAEATGLLDASDAGTPRVREAAPERDTAALQALAIWMRRFTPLVGTDPPDGLRLDVRGCTHLFGGSERLAGSIRSSLQGLHVSAVVAAAPAAAMAWGLARFGGPQIDVRRAGALPLAALRLSAEDHQALGEVGIETVSQAIDLPRVELAARFGEAVLRRIDAWTGDDPEPPIDGRPPERGIEVSRVFDGPVRDLEAIQLVMSQLLDELAAMLADRQRGAERIEACMHRCDRPDWRWAMDATRPTRDASHLKTIFRERLERVDVACGVESVALHVARDASLRGAQHVVWDVAPESACRTGLGALVDRLQARCGAVHMRREVDAYVVRSGCDGVAPGSPGDTGPGTRPDDVASSTHWRDRPTKLVSPVRIDVRLPEPGSHGLLRRQRHCWRVVVAAGPERLDLPWWTEAGRRMEPVTRTRDYWRVLREDGQWVWIYRCVDDWFLQGAWV